VRQRLNSADGRCAVVKRYDDVEAVRGIDLDIADHEFVVLVGRPAAASRPPCVIAGLRTSPTATS
jgi:hypothetical protein